MNLKWFRFLVNSIWEINSAVHSPSLSNRLGSTMTTSRPQSDQRMDVDLVAERNSWSIAGNFGFGLNRHFLRLFLQWPLTAHAWLYIVLAELPVCFAVFLLERSRRIGFLAMLLNTKFANSNFKNCKDQIKRKELCIWFDANKYIKSVYRGFIV